jgi:hypothetical protein
VKTDTFRGSRFVDQKGEPQKGGRAHYTPLTADSGGRTLLGAASRIQETFEVSKR